MFGQNKQSSIRLSAMNENSPPIIRLRGHHLLCLLTWRGVGYTPKFTEKFGTIASQINTYKQISIHIVKGKDDLCCTLDPDTTLDYHCDNQSNLERDQIALQDISTHLSTSLRIDHSFILTLRTLHKLREAFKQGVIRRGCQGCEWYKFCTDVANNAFQDTHINQEKT